MMKKRAISEQTIVITGASSGIGLATAYLAAEKGANVVLASRNEKDLREICELIEREGGTASWVKADVNKREDIKKMPDKAINTDQGIDSWVNNVVIDNCG